MKIATSLALLLIGCAGNQALDQSVLVADTASAALDVLDREIAPLYKRAAKATLRGLPDDATEDDYNEAMGPWNRLEEGLVAAHSALLAMQSALQAWDSGAQSAEGDYRNALACAVQGFRDVSDAAVELNVELDPNVDKFLALGATVAGECLGDP